MTEKTEKIDLTEVEVFPINKKFAYWAIDRNESIPKWGLCDNLGHPIEASFYDVISSESSSHLFLTNKTCDSDKIRRIALHVMPNDDGISVTHENGTVLIGTNLGIAGYSKPKIAAVMFPDNTTFSVMTPRQTIVGVMGGCVLIGNKQAPQITL